MLDFHPAAAAELQSSLAWYLERSAKAASAFRASVRQALAAIERNPECRPRDVRGFRAIRLHKYPFQIIYRETSRGLRVVAVAHTARLPDYWLDR
jgi:plasmid stabilization system protein ParE